ncbi:unnamed protein product [Rhizopus stolonifer]
MNYGMQDEQTWNEIMEDVSSVSCWAYELGIKEISVFDALGVMKSKYVELHKRQTKKLKEWIQVDEPYVKFSILSKENGKLFMSSVVNRLVKEVSIEKMDMACVDQYIHEDTISDPDLIIVFGGFPHSYVSLDGYSPWHLRHTEIINCNRHQRMNYHTLSQCLRRFSKLEQRFGR